jgi:hypothetical protein
MGKRKRELVRQFERDERARGQGRPSYAETQRLRVSGGRVQVDPRVNTEVLLALARAVRVSQPVDLLPRVREKPEDQEQSASEPTA